MRAQLAIVALSICYFQGMTGSRALAHCDTMDGPVVKAAQAALETNDLNLVLPWIPSDREAEIKDAFDLAWAVRGKGVQEKEVADRYFFETVVRIHRESEGETFQGLKPAGTDPGPVIPVAEQALESGDLDPLLTLLHQEIGRELKAHFAVARDKKTSSAATVEAGRDYVRAYVTFLHFAERLFADATTPLAHGEAASEHTGHTPEHEHQ